MKNNMVYQISALMVVCVLAAPLMAQNDPGVPMLDPALDAPPTFDVDDAPMPPTNVVPAPALTPAVDPTLAAEPEDVPLAVLEPEKGTDNGEIPLGPEVTISEDEVVTQNTGDSISITLDNVPLLDVVRMFTRISGANIIADPSQLEGAVTVNLTDVQWRPALSSILAMHSLALDEKELGTGVYTIVARSPDAPPPMTSKSFQLKFSSVGDVSPVVKKMLPEGAGISEFPSRNIIVVRSTSENLRDIQLLIEQIDIPTRQVCIETKFMELNDAASKQLGIRWDSLEEFGLRLDAGPMTYARQQQQMSTRDKYRGSYDSRQKANILNRTFDSAGTPIDPDIEEVFEDPPGSGLYSTRTIPVPTQTETVNRSSGNASSDDITRSFARTIAEQQTAVLNIDSLNVVLSALKKTDGVTVISNPKMLVASGEKDAYFSVGEREPIIKQEITFRGDNEEIREVTAELDTSINTDEIKEGYLRTGVDLRVIPVVKTDDLIEAQIMPSLKRKIGEKVVAENSWPIISVKQIQTKFTLTSGQTVAIGGLTDTRDSKEVSKIPLLGDIPFLGKYLFSHSADAKSQIETIIFVTLSLVEAETMDSDAGLPEHAELVHKEMIRSETRRLRHDSDMEVLKEAAKTDARKERRRKFRLMRKAQD